MRIAGKIVATLLLTLFVSSLATAAKPEVVSAATQPVLATSSVAPIQIRHEYTLTDRVIVRLKGDLAQDFAASSSAQRTDRRRELTDRLEELSAEPLTHVRVSSSGAHVMRLNRRMPLEKIQALTARMAQHPDVLEVMPDRLFFPALDATDPLYTSQWSLSQANGINIPGAWDITRGSSGLVIAVLDTGSLPHNDLAGRLIGGYDFVSGASLQNDGTICNGAVSSDPACRDNNPADPGDWVQDATGPFAGCPTQSTWHGAAMAGVIGAIANNGIGIAGINWNSKILPVRVLGKCGGYESDIADGLRWAAGLYNIPTVGFNPNIARVANLSLAIHGSCVTTQSSPTEIQLAITAAVNAGVSVIVSAGNHGTSPDIDAASYTPGNCTGVINVGAVDKIGGLPAYANRDLSFPSKVTVAAPGGVGEALRYYPNASPPNTVNDLWATSDSGLTGPIGDHVYATTYGTSVAAAQVSGVASLMLSVNPALSPQKVKDIIVSSARNFPVGTGSAEDCTTTKCGGGIVNAAQAVQAARDAVIGSKIATGGGHTCLLNDLGAVKCWGNNDSGQLGDNSVTSRLIPVDVVGLSSGNAVVAAGDVHTCVLTTVGGVKCWGNNGQGQLGDNSTTQRLAPIDVLGLGITVAHIAAGGGHTCVLTTVGGVKCWGDNLYGQLGDGTTINRSQPVDVLGLTTGVTAITAGGFNTCAITNFGAAKCWGANDGGQVGDNTRTLRRLEPVNVVGLASGVAAIALGKDQHTCALTTLGGVKCWGNNASGQLGNNSATLRSLTPVDVAGFASGAAAIALGVDHTCALTIVGGVKCWGANFYGQLGDNSTTSHPAPNDVVGLGNGIAAISLGNNYSCAFAIAGVVKCWGFNNSGQLGDGTTVPRALPAIVTTATDTSPDVFGFQPQNGALMNALLTSNQVTISGINVAAPISISIGEYSIGCSPVGFTSTSSTIKNGQIVCVRHTSASSLGTSVTSTLTIGSSSGAFVSTTPFAPYYDYRRRLTLNNIDQIAAGYEHTCALTTAGGVKCWGDNADGELGDGSNIHRLTPVNVSGLASGVKAISAGAFHTCALTNAGGVKCWGNNLDGELGDGTIIRRSVPVDVMGLATGVKAIAGGGNYTCALTTAGGVKCWGMNVAGGLGDGSTIGRLTPVDVMGLTSGVLAIAAGNNHACAITALQGVKCWGGNENGQLGNGSFGLSAVPVDVSGLATGVTAITVGANHSCVITNSGGMKCWGRNDLGALGDGTGVQQTLPVDVVGLQSGVAAIDAGTLHTCAVTTANALKCWGNNFRGQLGEDPLQNPPSEPFNRMAPVDVFGLPNGVLAVAAGNRHTCALDNLSRVACWGYNRYGQLGDNSATPHAVRAFVNYPTATITASLGRTCALSNAGKVKCWGYALDPGFPFTRLIPVEVPALVGIVTAISTGTEHTCVVIDGGIQCWGGNYFGQLGNNTIGGFYTTPVQIIPAGSGATAVAAGNGHTCAVIDGGAKCWGKNTWGQLGNNTTQSSLVPVQAIPPGSDVTAIAVSGDGPGDPDLAHSCAVVSGGVQCWGDNSSRQLSGHSGNYSSSPTTALSFLSEATSVATGRYHTCATSFSGIQCWGSNSYGEFGRGDTSPYFLGPEPMIPNQGSTDTILTAFGSHTCAINYRDNGVEVEVFRNCWGANFSGQLGNGKIVTVGGQSGSVSAGSYPHSALAIAAGFFHTCEVRFLDSEQRVDDVTCWGGNDSGQLGINSTQAQTLPVRVLGTEGDGYLSLDAAYPAPFVLLPRVGVERLQAVTSNAITVTGISNPSPVTITGGSVNINNSGFTSGGTVSNGASVVVRVTSSSAYNTAVTAKLDIGGQASTFSVRTRNDPSSIPVAPAVALGNDFSLVLGSSGIVYAAGYNAMGQMGTGTTLHATRYGPVAGLANVTRIAAGGRHALALTSAGEVFSWGFNAAGQLGNSTTANSSGYPALVSGLGTIKAIAAGQDHSLALTTSGAVFSWGLGAEGQLGRGLALGIPSAVPGLPTIVAIAAGGRHSIAIDASGNVWVWGANESGQLGDGTTLIKSVPAQLTSITNVVAISAGAAHTLALKSDGTLWAWGANTKGQVGDGSTTNRLAPVMVSTNVTGIAAGGEHSLALKLGGLLFSWGSNESSQLGDGTLNSRSVPTFVVGLGGLTAVAAGSRHTGVITKFGEVLLWGKNDDGQLGNRSGGTISGKETNSTGRGVARRFTAQAGTQGSPPSNTTPSVTGSHRLLLQDLDYFEGNFGEHPTSDPATLYRYFYRNQEPAGSVGKDIEGLTTTVSAAPFSLVPVNCPSTLVPGSECEFDVQFAPPAAGYSEAVISIAGSTITGVEPYTLSGTGVDTSTPAMSLSRDFIRFSSRPLASITSSELESVTVTNTGSTALIIATNCPANATSAKSCAANFTTTHTCGASLAAKASCTVQIAFRPGTAGDIDTTLTIQGMGTPVTRTVSLSGFGSGATANIEPDPFVFGPDANVPASSVRTSDVVLITGITLPVAISITSTGNGAYSIGCGSTFINSPGTINPNDRVCVRHTSAAAASTPVQTTLLVGNKSATFTSTTAGFTAPSPPTISSISPGSGQATISFSTPNNGGSPITLYTANCGGLTASSSGSPITVPGLANGTLYTCSVTATNSIGTSVASGTATVTPAATVTLSLVGVESRKTHGTAGSFALPVSAADVNGLPTTVEPRVLGSAGHVIVFLFNTLVNSVGTVTAVDSTNAAIGTSILRSGNEVAVTLPSLADNKRVTISISVTGVNGSASASAVLGFLVGDVNGSRSVNSSDISGVKARSGQVTTLTNFKFDLNASGGVNSSDISAVKARSGLVLP